MVRAAVDTVVPSTGQRSEWQDLHGWAQAQVRGEPLARRASPVARGISAIAVRHGLGKSLKTFVSLPLLPASCVASKHKVIGRVPDAHLPAIWLDRRV